MRLVVCGSKEQDDIANIKSALANLNLPGASVLINPDYLLPDPNEHLWIACGKGAVDHLQSAGWIPKKGGVESNRGKLFQVQPDGWTSPIHVGTTYSPLIRHIEYNDFVMLEADLKLYQRFEKTGTLEPQLGRYTWAADFQAVIDYLKYQHESTKAPVELAIDLETMGLHPWFPDKHILTVSLTGKIGYSDVVDLRGKTAFQIEMLIKQLKWLLTQPWIKTIGANLKFDLLWLRVKWGVVCTNFTFDTCNGGSLVEENRPNTLNLHAKIYAPELGGYDDEFNRTFDKAHMETVPPENLLPYAGGDTDAALRVYHGVRQQLLSDNVTASGKPAKNSLTSVYINVVHPALKALHKVEFTGVYVDTDKFHAFGADLDNRMVESTQKALAHLPKALLNKHGGPDENGGAPLSKPNLAADFLFSPSGLNLTPLQTTEKTGKPSTAEFHLAMFKDHPEAGPFIAQYLDYKSVAKMHGTYYKGFLSDLRPDNRWHATYIIHKAGSGKDNESGAAGTVTGRGSAVGPAFQCVSGDAEILTPDGMQLARDIIDPVIGDLITGPGNPFAAHVMQVAGRGGWKATSNVFRSWRGDILTVTLRCGNELKCTPEHPVLTSNRGWVKAADLAYTDALVLPQGKTDRLEAPTGYDLNFAYLLGTLWASKAVTAFDTITYVDGEEETLALVKEAAKRCGRATVDYVISNSPVVAILHKDGYDPLFDLFGDGDLTLPLNLRATKIIPFIILGMFEVAGRIISPTHLTRTVRIPMPNRGFALALLREAHISGMAPPYLVATEAGGWALEWRGSSAIEVAQEGEFRPPEWPLPPPLSDFYRYPSRPHAAMQVASAVMGEPGWVYDFTVPDGHEFIANGLVVHNTVPKHSYWGKRLRECIIAPPGHVILSRDYAQGELKVAACWAGEAKMIQAYRNGIDLHLLTAATVNGMSYEEAKALKAVNEAAYDALRQNGKAGNFGLLYGMSAYGFMMYADAVYGVKLTLEEAEAMRDAYFNLYPGLTAWHARQIQEARTCGFVRSPLGRTRRLHNIHSPIKKVRETSENQAINSPIQGTLVDFMWMSMGIIEEQKPELLTPFAQVHDQGLWYSPEDRVDEALVYSGEIMENLPLEAKFGWKPELTFTTDAEVGYNLASLKKIPKVAA